MDLTVLSRKISSYRTPKGKIFSLPDELLGEILHAWEQWSGPAAGFYKELGVDFRKMGSLMGRAKKLKREGAFDGLNFTEVIIEGETQGLSDTSCPPSSGCSIELIYKNNVIRFGSSDLLLDFLKKAA
jgi:hypothetical protein